MNERNVHFPPQLIESEVLSGRSRRKFNPQVSFLFETTGRMGIYASQTFRYQRLRRCHGRLLMLWESS